MQQQHVRIHIFQTLKRRDAARLRDATAQRITNARYQLQTAETLKYLLFVTGT